MEEMKKEKNEPVQIAEKMPEVVKVEPSKESNKIEE